MTELPLAPVRRILKDAGASRVSEDAVETLADALEDYARDLTSDAVDLARNAKRSTVQKKDVREAQR